MSDAVSRRFTWDYPALERAEKDTTGEVIAVADCACGGKLTRQFVKTVKILGRDCNLVNFTCTKGGEACLR